MTPDDQKADANTPIELPTQSTPQSPPDSPPNASNTSETDAASDDDGVKVEGSTDDPLFEPVVNAIQQVYDPEIPVNIYELGLIYRVDIDGENNVHVIMTLTSPACPSAQELPLQVRGGVAVVPGVKDVEVDVTFDPPWGPDKMSEVARVTLGMM